MLISSSGRNFLSSTTSPIVQNEWAVFAGRFSASKQTFELLKNGISIASASITSTIPDFTSNYGFMGKPVVSSDAYTNGNIAGLYIYDRYLSDYELSFVSYQLTLKGLL
jgi:hypothetical protein